MKNRHRDIKNYHVTQLTSTFILKIGCFYWGGKTRKDVNV